MRRPTPTPIFHFTHVDHLGSVIQDGLLCDELAQAGGLEHEIGEPRIKRQRRGVRVKVSPGGTVDQYAPWYYAPRSPMLYTLNRNGKLAPHGGQDAQVYLCSTVQHLQALGLPLVFTDRNAYYDYARHSNDESDLDSLIEWPLIRARVWKNTDEEPDRMERRMAECLVYGSVPWEGILAIGTKSQARADQVQAMVSTAEHQPDVLVKPGWYY